MVMSRRLGDDASGHGWFRPTLIPLSRSGARGCPAHRASRALATTSKCSRGYNRGPSTWTSQARTLRPELIQLGVGRTEDALGLPGRDPVRILVVEVVPPRVHPTGQRLHVHARDSPRGTNFPADRRRPALMYSATVHRWQSRMRAASTCPTPSTGRSDTH
jgi:hypothetical protein